ncbi:MAG: phage holin family protein [Caulobacteraceae bacterium]
MARFILRALIAALGLWVASHVVPGVHVTGWTTLAVAGALLGVANALVRPIVAILTFPITLLTLGLFLLVVNGLMVLLVGWILHVFHDQAFQIHGLFSAILATIVIWLVSLAANVVLGDEKKQRA